MNKNFNLTSSKINSKKIRALTLKINHISKTSHLASVLSMADLINILFFDVINFKFPPK